VFDRAHHFLKNSALSLIVLDIDFFKRINDEFGHPTGDAVIRELVNRLRKSLNGKGEIGRVGGEEFTRVPLRCWTRLRCCAPESRFHPRTDRLRSLAFYRLIVEHEVREVFLQLLTELENGVVFFVVVPAPHGLPEYQE
jgi:GGDEF domain-containing protein